AASVDAAQFPYPGKTRGAPFGAGESGHRGQRLTHARLVSAKRHSENPLSRTTCLSRWSPAHPRASALSGRAPQRDRVTRSLSGRDLPDWRRCTDILGAAPVVQPGRCRAALRPDLTQPSKAATPRGTTRSDKEPKREDRSRARPVAAPAPPQARRAWLRPR